MPQPPRNQPPQQQPPTTSMIVATLQSPAFTQEIKAFLPPHVDLKKFMQAAIVAVQRNAAVLAQCERQSVYNAIADAASRGLVPDGRQGALVPYRTRKKVGDSWTSETRCQFLIMPEGIIESAARAGTALYAVSIHANDEVEIWNDADGQHFVHKPAGVFSAADRGERVGAVAVAKLRNGQVYVEAMGVEELERARQASKQKDDNGNPTGPWRDWPERMEQKTVLHRLHRRIPGIPLEDDEEYAGPSGRVRLAEPEMPKSLPSATLGPAQAPAPDRERPRALRRVLDEQGAVLAQDSAGAGSSPEQRGQPEPPAATAAPPPAVPRGTKEDDF